MAYLLEYAIVTVCYSREHSSINMVNIRYEHNLIDTLNIIHFVLSIIQKIELHFLIQQPHIIYPKYIS